MYKKLNFKTLLILFSILLTLVLITLYVNKQNGERNFNSNIVNVDTAKISAIYIKPINSPNETKISRNGNSWTFLQNGKNIRTDKQAIMGMIIELSNIKAERVAATEKSEWETYKVTDSTATRVRVEEGGKITADFMVGKFSYQQNPQKFSTYVRLTGEDEVYSVPGYMSMTFGRGINDLRDKTVANFNVANITRITYTYPGDSSFILTAGTNNWKIGENYTDSAKTAQYLNGLANLSSYDMVADNAQTGPLLFTAKIEGNSITPFEIKAFASDSVTKYIVTSDQNPETRFSGANGNIISKVFASQKQFFASKK
jgi:hypothetical protein